MKPVIHAALGAFALAASVGSSLNPAEANVIVTINASGPIGSGAFGTTATGGTYFGLSPASFVGAHADVSWTIDVGQLGAPATGPDFAVWGYADANLASLGPITSPTPIGITGYVTINGITLTTGINRQFLILAQNPDFLELGTNTLTQGATFIPLRDSITLFLATFNPFLLSLNPQDLVGVTLPACNVDNGDVEFLTFRHLETWNGVDGPDAQATFTRGAIDLCGASAQFSVSETPEPSSFALIAAGLLSLFGLGLMRPALTLNRNSRLHRGAEGPVEWAALSI